VLVNAICPGVFPSRMTSFGLTENKEILEAIQPTGASRACAAAVGVGWDGADECLPLQVASARPRTSVASCLCSRAVLART
jgi:hypothetical protein